MRAVSYQLLLEGLNLVKAESESPDLILMDMNLPGMSGMEALGRLREDDQLCAIPVIALSADAIPRNIELALEAGFSNFITKPIEIDKLLVAIDEVFKDRAK